MPTASTWITRGFEAFRRGTFGNAGQNIYVSRKGVLQRIHLFDLNRDGNVDLVFCNAQDHWEQPPAYVYHDALGQARRVELPADGAATGVVADLNGDGYDDIVLGMHNNGIERELNAFIYFGSAKHGWGERAMQRVPAPVCTSAAAGDFNGNGRCDLALLCEGKVRVFHRNELGYEPRRHVDPGISGSAISAADLDGDGFADLYVLPEKGAPRVYWGGRDGLNAARFTELPHEVQQMSSGDGYVVSLEEAVASLAPMASIVRLGGVAHLFVPRKAESLLVPIEGRTLGAALTFRCGHAVAVAACDTNGDGHADLAFACRDKLDGREVSWLYHGSRRGFDESRRTALPTLCACDVATGDLNGNGCDDIVICQHRSHRSYSIQSPVFAGSRAGIITDPRMLASEGARRVFIARSCDDANPQVVFVNQFARGATGEVPPVIYWNDGKGFDAGRHTYLSGVGAVQAVGCDITDNGTADLLFANCAENAMHLDSGSRVFLGSKDGFKPEPDIMLPTRAAMGVVVGDINRDGYLDAIFSSFRDNEVTIFHGCEGGFDTAHPQRIVFEEDGKRYGEGRRMCLADLNNDGWLDLVVSFMSADRTFVLWGGPDGFDFSRRQTLSVVRSSTPMAADLTGNGYLDLIIGCHKRSDAGPHDCWVYIYWNGPEGLSEDRRTLLPAHAVLGMALADFNNDGALDLFVANYSNGRERDLESYVYWGAKPGTDQPPFSAQRVTRFMTHSAAGCMAADFNNDGYVDLAIANHKNYGDHKGDSFIIWNGPNGLDFANPTRLPTFGPHGMMPTPPGNQRDRSDEEHYISEPFEMPAGAQVVQVETVAELPPQTWLHVHIRTAATREALAHAPWQPAPTPGTPGTPAPPGRPGSPGSPGPWVQYRLTLGARNSGNTPRVTEVRLHHR